MVIEKQFTSEILPIGNVPAGELIFYPTTGCYYLVTDEYNEEISSVHACNIETGVMFWIPAFYAVKWLHHGNFQILE